jgi:hypothetical protein
LGKLTEAQQRKVMRIIGMRESQTELDRKTTPGASPKKGETRIDTLPIRVAVGADEGAKVVKLFAAIIRHGNEQTLIDFLVNGIVSEPAKEAEQMIDGLAEVATHFLNAAGIDEEMRDNFCADLDEKIYQERLKKLQRRCKWKGLPIPTHL